MGNDLDWLRNEFKKRFEIKFKGRLGPGENDDKAVGILNRVVSWTDRGIEYEADQRHSEIIIAALGLRGKKSTVSPRIKTSSDTDDPEDEFKLYPPEASMFLNLVAPANYLSQDRLDIKFPVKELSRWQSQPRRKDAKRLIRLAKYLIRRERYSPRHT